MTARLEVLVFGCHKDDLVVLAEAVGRVDLELRIIDDPGEWVRRAVSHRPLAIILAVGSNSVAYLDMISLSFAIGRELPVIVVAEDASLGLERRARQREIFYYLVRPIGLSEVVSVLQDLLRSSKKTGFVPGRKT